MGETKVFGVKVPEELHSEAAKLQKEFGTGEEFLAAVIASYKAEKTKESVPAVAEDLKELQSLTHRINNIYLNLAYRVDNLGKQKDAEYQDVIQKKDSLVYDLQFKSGELESQVDVLTTAYNNLVNDKNEVSKRVNELTEMNESNKALIDEYRSKNDMLTGMLQKYEKYPEQLEEYKKLLADSQAKNGSLLNEVSLLSDENMRLTQKSEEITLSHKEQLKEIEERHQQEIARIKDQAEFNKDKALLDKDREHQTIIAKLNSEHAEKVRELLNENQEHNARVGKLMEENQAKESKINDLMARIAELQAAAKGKKTTRESNS